MSPKRDIYVGLSTNIVDFLGYVGTSASKSEYDTYNFRAKRLYESRVMPFSVLKPVFSALLSKSTFDSTRSFFFTRWGGPFQNLVCFSML